MRRVTEKDKSIFVELTKEFYNSPAVIQPIPESTILRTFHEIIRSNEYIEGFIIENENQDVGYGIISKSFSPEAGGPVIWFEEVYVRDGFQGKGLGREFFGFIEEAYKEQVKRLRLEVEADNERAVDLYKRLGYDFLKYNQMVKDFE